MVFEGGFWVNPISVLLCRRTLKSWPWTSSIMVLTPSTQVMVSLQGGVPTGPHSLPGFRTTVDRLHKHTNSIRKSDVDVGSVEFTSEKTKAVLYHFLLLFEKRLSTTAIPTYNHLVLQNLSCSAKKRLSTLVHPRKRLTMFFSAGLWWWNSLFYKYKINECTYIDEIWLTMKWIL